jgi:hypothetical protein
MNWQSLIGPAIGMGVTAATGGAGAPLAGALGGLASQFAQGGNFKDMAMGAGMGAATGGLTGGQDPLQAATAGANPYAEVAQGFNGGIGAEMAGAAANPGAIAPPQPKMNFGDMDFANILQNANAAIGFAGGLKSLAGGGQIPQPQLPGAMPPMTIGQLASNYGQQNQGPRY